MTIQHRQALWIQSNGTPQQAQRAALYVRHQTPTTTAALGLLFSKVCAA